VLLIQQHLVLFVMLVAGTIAEDADLSFDHAVEVSPRGICTVVAGVWDNVGITIA